MIQKVKLQCENCGAPLVQQNTSVWKCEHCAVPYLIVDNAPIPTPAAPRPTLHISSCTYSNMPLPTYFAGDMSVFDYGSNYFKARLPRIDWE